MPKQLVWSLWNFYCWQRGYIEYIYICEKDQSFYNFHLGNVRLLASDIQSYEISETTYPIGLKFSGIRKGFNGIAVLKFQNILITLR